MKHIFIAMTNATEGKDEEFSKWYDDVHLPEVLDTAGFVAAQRYQLNDVQLGTHHPYKYLTIYELEMDDPESTLEALKSRSPTFDISLLGPAPMPALYSTMGGRVTETDFKK